MAASNRNRESGRDSAGPQSGFKIPAPSSHQLELSSCGVNSVGFGFVGPQKRSCKRQQWLARKQRIILPAKMASTHIFEDQENRVPAAQRRVKREDPRTSSNVQVNRRPVLGAINTNLRKQPARAAKQVCGGRSVITYETTKCLKERVLLVAVWKRDVI